VARKQSQTITFLTQREKHEIVLLFDIFLRPFKNLPLIPAEIESLPPVVPENQLPKLNVQVKFLESFCNVLKELPKQFLYDSIERIFSVIFHLLSNVIKKKDKQNRQLKSDYSSIRNKCFTAFSIFGE